jgi:hypothetical protein
MRFRITIQRYIGTQKLKACGGEAALVMVTVCPHSPSQFEGLEKRGYLLKVIYSS